MPSDHITLKPKAGDYWFVPKSKGYGATPKNWKGWMATLVFGVLTLALATVPSLAPHLLNTPHWPYRLALWLAAIAAVIVGFLKLAQAKTDGEWRWRWDE